MANYSMNKGEVFDAAVNSTFFSLEGYMLGTFVGIALQRTEYNLSVDNFLNAIYETAIFSLGGLRLGPYGPDCTQSFTGCKCNQVTPTPTPSWFVFIYLIYCRVCMRYFSPPSTHPATFIKFLGRISLFQLVGTLLQSIFLSHLDNHKNLLSC